MTETRICISGVSDIPCRYMRTDPTIFQCSLLVRERALSNEQGKLSIVGLTEERASSPRETSLCFCLHQCQITHSICWKHSIAEHPRKLHISLSPALQRKCLQAT